MKRTCQWLLIFALLSYCAPFAAAQKRLPSVRVPRKAGTEILPKLFRVPLVKVPVVRMPGRAADFGLVGCPGCAVFYGANAVAPGGFSG